MYIKKTYNGVVPNGKVLNSDSSSLTDTYSCDYINNMNNYSTEEIQIGTWLGKPLYRKVVEIPSLPNATTGYYNSGLSNVSIKNIYGYCESDIQTFPLNNANPTGLQYQVQLWYVYDNNQIYIQTAQDRSNYKGAVVLEYTKSTD